MPPIAHLHLDITNHCNFRCEFCFHYGDLRARRGFMDTGLALRLIDEAADKRLASELSTAVFGEALLHPDFFTIAEHAVRRGLKLTLNTKGGLLDEQTSRRICELGIHKLIVSLNTHDEQSYRINHAPQGLDHRQHVERLTRFIDLKFETGSDVHVFVYVMSTWYAAPRGLVLVNDHPSASRVVGEWRERCAEIAERHGLTPPAPTTALVRRDLVARKWPIDRGIELLPGVELVLKEGHLWGNRMLGPELEPVPTTRGSCPLPWVMLTVHWDGSCSLCCLDYNREAVVGNVNDSSLEEVFNGERMRGIRERMSRGHVDEPLCQVCLGGVRDKRSGRLVKRAQSSGFARWLGAVEKYGVYESLRYGWDRLKQRLEQRRAG